MRRAPRLIHEVQRLGLTVSIAALLIVLLVVFRLVWSVAVTAPTDARLQSGLLALEDSHQAMLDMDASLRGYLATGDQFFADSATGAAPALAAADTQMVNLLEEPQLRQDVLALLLAQQRWRTEWADQARQLPPPGGAEAFLKQGTALFDDYRARKDGTRVDTLAAIEAADRSAVANQFVIGVLLGARSASRRSSSPCAVGTGCSATSSSRSTACSRRSAGSARDAWPHRSPCRGPPSSWRCATGSPT